MASAATEQEQPKPEIETEAITAVSKGLNLYTKTLDEKVPWKDFKNLLKELYRYTSEYSKESAQAIGEIRTELENYSDEYFKTTQTVRELCDLTTMFLDIYDAGIKNSNSAENEKVLIAVLEEAAKGLKNAQTSVTATSEHGCNLSGKFGILLACLERDFDENSDFFKKQVEKLEMTSTGSLTSAFGLLPTFLGNKDKSRENIIAHLKQRLASVKQFHTNSQTKVDAANLVIYDVKFLSSESIALVEKIKVEIQKPAADPAVPVDEAQKKPQADTESQNAINDAIKKLSDQCKAYLANHETLF